MHRRLAQLFALVLVVVATPAQAQSSALDLADHVDLTGFPVHIDPDGRFTVTYPAPWTERNEEGGACFFAGFVRPHDVGPPDVAMLSVTCDRYARLQGLVVADVAQALEIDTDERFAAFVTAIEDETGDEIEPLTRGPAALAGRPAFRWVYRQTVDADGGLIVLRTLQYIVIEGGTQFGVSCASSEDLWQDGEVLCEALARTFTLGS